MQAALQNSQNGSTEVVMHGQNIRLPTFIIAPRAASQAAEAAANADTIDDAITRMTHTPTCIRIIRSSRRTASWMIQQYKTCTRPSTLQT